MKKKIMLFAQLVTEIDISKYKQKQYIKIVKAIYWEIYGLKKGNKFIPT
mgnify:CR=1 FL=1